MENIRRLILTGYRYKKYNDDSMARYLIVTEEVVTFNSVVTEIYLSLLVMFFYVLVKSFE